jgi:GT2 family glycosyltransferase
MLENAKLRTVLPKGAEVKVVHPERWTGRRPSATVVIPCYNYGHYVTACVQSVLEQDDVDVDIIVIDDASPDGSADVVSSLPGIDDRIRAICHSENKGHIATYNEGLAQAKGDYTVLLSADDMLTPGSLSRVTALMESHPQVGMAYGSSLVFENEPMPTPRSTATAWIIWNGADWIAHHAKVGFNSLRSPEAVIRTTLMHEIGYYRPDLPHAGDFEMWMRAATVSRIGYVAGADQAYYRSHGSSMHHSSFDMTADLAQRLHCFDVIFDEHSQAVKNSSAIHEQAHRTLARESLQRAIYIVVQKNPDDELADHYISFARQTWPRFQELAEWRALRKLHGPGKTGASQRFQAMPCRIYGGAEYRFRTWRHKIIGV